MWNVNDLDSAENFKASYLRNEVDEYDDEPVPDYIGEQNTARCNDWYEYEGGKERDEIPGEDPITPARFENDIDDEAVVMRALSNGNGDLFGY